MGQREYVGRMDRKDEPVNAPGAKLEARERGAGGSGAGGLGAAPLGAERHGARERGAEGSGARERETQKPRVRKLSAQALSLSWDGMTVCGGVSFDVFAHELVCLLGRSGSGKSTVFHALAGLSTPDAGAIILDSEDITGQPGHMSYMLQKDLLLPEHTIIDNVSMPLVVNGMRKKAARAEACRYFETFGITGTEKHYPCQLSGGMRQRAALLRTYLMRKDVMLMDEPFSALDAFTRAELRGWFLNMFANLDTTCLFVTHDIDEAIAMADRILVLVGNPAAGRPSSIAGEVAVARARDCCAASIKEEVLALLNQD